MFDVELGGEGGGGGGSSSKRRETGHDVGENREVFGIGIHGAFQGLRGRKLENGGTSKDDNNGNRRKRFVIYMGLPARCQY